MPLLLSVTKITITPLTACLVSLMLYHLFYVTRRCVFPLILPIVGIKASRVHCMMSDLKIILACLAYSIPSQYRRYSYFYFLKGISGNVNMHSETT